MAHPSKSESVDSHTAKLRRMTRDYGMAGGPSEMKLAPQEFLKREGGEKAIGFGADPAKPRMDKRARGGKVRHKRADGGPTGSQSATGTNIANQQQSSMGGMSQAEKELQGRKRGGHIKKRDTGGAADSPIEEANMNQKANTPGDGRATGGVIARASGGRTHGKKHKGSTHVNVIVAPQGGGGPGMPPPGAVRPVPPVGGPPPGAMPPPGAGGPPGMPPGAPKPMMPPGGMPPGAMPPGAMPPGAMPPRASGGSVEKELKDEGLVRERKRGGRTEYDAGAGSGEGRLEKIEAYGHKSKGKPQPV